MIIVLISIVNSRAPGAPGRRRPRGPGLGRRAARRGAARAARPGSSRTGPSGMRSTSVSEEALDDQALGVARRRGRGSAGSRAARRSIWATAAAWVQRTSSASISRPGIASACAFLESSRLRLSWKASVCWAPGSTRIIPRQTAVARSASTPRKARSEVVCGGGVLLGGVEVEVLGAVAGVGAGDLGADEPWPASLVSIRTLPRAEPKPSATQSSVASRSTSARWVANTQLRSRELLLADVAQVRAGADDQLDDAVEEARRARRSEP